MTADTDTMPALPEPLVMINRYGLSASTADGDGGVFTADQTLSYGRQCAEQERERIIALLAGRCARASSLARIFELQDAIEAIRKVTP